MFRASILIDFITSVTIELLQLITRTGACETDDVICNTVGCGIGAVMVYGLRFIVYGVFKWFKIDNNDERYFLHGASVPRTECDKAQQPNTQRRRDASQVHPAHVVHPAHPSPNSLGICRELNEQPTVSKYCCRLPNRICDDPDCVELPEGFEKVYGRGINFKLISACSSGRANDMVRYHQAAKRK